MGAARDFSDRKSWQATRNEHAEPQRRDRHLERNLPNSIGIPIDVLVRTNRKRQPGPAAQKEPFANTLGDLQVQFGAEQDFGPLVGRFELMAPRSQPTHSEATTAPEQEAVPKAFEWAKRRPELQQKKIDRARAR